MQEPVKDRALSPARLSLSIILGGVLAAPLVIALAALSGIGHRWADILSQFTGPALVIAVAVLMVGALTRLGLVSATAAGVCAAVLLAGWPQWAPPRGAAPQHAPGFTLYSANLHRDNADIAAIARSIAASDADVVVLVEVGPAPAAALDVVLAGYPYRAVRGPVDQTAGNVLTVIASRRPLEDLRLEAPGLSIEAARVETAIGPVTIAGAHLTRPWPYQIQWEQIRQAERLSSWARSTAGPVIAAGDFNSVSSARIGRLIQSEGGLVPAPGWPGTWPSRLPAFAGITIDQVYRTPDLALTERRLGRSTGSDHRPVITRFVRATPPAP